MERLNIVIRMRVKKSSNSKPQVLLILGCTASGKSDIVSTLSDFLNIELISADSVQVYKGLDIGSAKPSKTEMAKFPHHLIDIKNFDETFSVGDFVNTANSLVTEIVERSNIPIISGGTFFYIKNFIYGLSDSPGSNKEIREKIEKKKQELGLAALYEKLKELDPVYASKISINDAQRITRALEICEMSGKRVSDFPLNNVIRNDIDIKIYAVDMSRELLKVRIKERIDKMFEMGLEQEVLKLKSLGATKDMQSMKGIGYREFFDESLSNIEEIKNAIYLDTVHYAKRQATFIRSLPNVKYATRDEIINNILKKE